MGKKLMTVILALGAITGTYIGTQVVSDTQKEYTMQLEKKIKTLEEDLLKTQLQCKVETP